MSYGTYQTFEPLRDFITCESAIKEACAGCYPPNCYCEFTCLPQWLLINVFIIGVIVGLYLLKKYLKGEI